MNTADNPYVLRIFEMSGFITGKERIGVAVSLIATEAYQMAQLYPDFAEYMDRELGKNWYANAQRDKSLETVIKFFEYVKTGAFAKGPATLEA